MEVQGGDGECHLGTGSGTGFGTTWDCPTSPAALLAVLLLAVFATGAQAQVECSSANADDSYTVPYDWELKPSGLTSGTSFRLMFVTSTERDATSADIATYNTFVQTRAKAGPSEITDSCGNRFTVLGSTPTIDARTNTRTRSSDTGASIHWLKGAKVADNYADLYDGSWDSKAARLETGALFPKSGHGVPDYVLTGSNNDGTHHPAWAFGSSSGLVRWGNIGGFGSSKPIRHTESGTTTEKPFYGLSPVFKVGPVLSVSLGSSSGNEGATGSSYVNVDIELSSTRSARTEFLLCVKDTGAATFRSASGGKAADFDLVHFGNDQGLTMNADNCHAYGISAGFASSSVRLRIFGDTVPEGSETAVLELRRSSTTPDDVVISPTAASATYTIDNDDGSAPTITVSGGAVVTEGTGAQFTVRASPAPSVNLTVQLDVSDDDTSDFVASADEGRKTVTIQANRTSATFTVDTTADSADEPNGEVRVALASAEGYTVGSASSAATTVNDDDVPSEITISAGASPVTEGRAARFTLSASPAPGVTLKVKLNIAEAAGSDFVASGDEGAQTLTIRAGLSSATYTVDTVADRVDEPDGSVTVRVEAGEGYTVGDTSSARVTVKDNDTRALVLTPPSKLSLKEGGKSTYTVRLATRPTAAVTVRVSSSAAGVTVDTGGETDDDQNTLTFNPSGAEIWSTPQTVSVRAAHDDDGSDESVLLRHFVSGGDYGTSQDTKLRVSVKDDDPVELDISKGALTVVEGDSGDYRVRLATEPTGTVTVAITSNNPGVSVSPSSLTFNAAGATNLWSEAQRVTVSAGEDDDAGHYSATLSLSASGGDYKGKAGAVAVSVKDNDTRGLALSPDALRMPEASSLFYTVRLATEPTGTVTVAIASDDPAVSVSPASLTFNASGGTHPWSTEQMVTVATAEDDDGVSETVTLTHSPSGGDYGSSENASLPVSVTDDDPRGLLLSTTKVFVSEDASSTYTARLLTEPTAPVTVDIASDNPDVTVHPAELTFTASGGSAWNTDQTVTVSAGADGDRQNERATLTHMARGGDYANQPLSGTVEAIVSEAQPLRQPNMPRINILRYGKHVPGQRPVGAHLPVIEGTAASFTVIASSEWQPDGPVTITVLVSEDESEGQDFVAPGDEHLQTLILHPWRDGLAKLYQVPTVNDAANEPNGAVTVRVMPGVDYIAGSSGTVEVLDDDMDKGLVFLVPLGTDSVGMGEGSGTFYRVRLAAPPAGDVTVTVSGHPTGADPRLTVDRTTLVFTPENWIEPQPVSVFANSDADIDDEEYRLLHTASGGGYDSVSKHLLAFVIDDDPEHRKTDTLELMFHPEHNPRQHSVTEGDSGTRSKSFYVRTDKPHPSELGFRLCFGAGAAWGEDYRLRQREGSDWTDVRLTKGCFDSHIPANERHRELGIEVLGDVCPEAETEVVNIHLTERRDRPLPPPREIDSVHHTSGVYIRDDDRGKPVCTGVRSGTGPPVPDTPVTNVQVSTVDDASAAVSWDAVEHATSYRVSWEAEGSDPQLTITGIVPSVAGTSATIRHDAREAMTLTLTVTPEYVDGNGDTQRLDALAGTATLAVAPSDPQSADPQSVVTAAARSAAADACVSEHLMATTERYYGINRHKAPGYGANWFSVLVAFGERTPTEWTTDSRTILPMSAASSRERESRWHGWRPFTKALECVEAALAAAPDDAATVAVADNDAAAAGPTISIADATFREGERGAYFTVTLSEPVDRMVRLHYATRDSTPVSATADQDYYAFRRSRRLRHDFLPGETELRIPVFIWDDSHDEDPETFEMVLFDADDGVSIADGVALGTIVNSDPIPKAWLSRFGRTVAEQALGGIAERMAAPRDHGVAGALGGQAFTFGRAGPDGSGAGATGGAGAAHDTVARGGAGLSGSEAGRPTRSDTAERPRWGTTQAPGAASARFAGPGRGEDAHGPGAARTLTLREALLGSRFTATGKRDASGGSLAFWGRAAQSSFDAREGSFSLDGEASTALLGADYARGDWLLGLALTQSAGKGSYAERGTGAQECPEAMDESLCNGTVREGDGEVEASLAAVMPYAALDASQRLSLWGTFGYGAGEVTLEPETGGALESDLSWTMAAAGVRGEVLSSAREGSGPALALTSDALWARTSTEKTHELAASDSNVTRLRLGLEGRWRIATPGDGHVTPKLEAGMRHDGGDAETGFGVELGGGVAWSAPALGLSLDLSGRTLIAHHDDDLKNRGFASSLAFDPAPATRRGLSLTLTRDWGAAAQGGLDALFRNDPLGGRSASGTASATGRWAAEAAYGFSAFGGRFTGSPHVGLGLATGARDYTLGWRLEPAANADNALDLSLGVKATRREGDAAAPEHALGVELGARW